MPDILCGCAQCFREDDSLRLLPLRTVNLHILQHGWPSEQQLKTYALDLTSRETSETRNKTQVIIRAPTSAGAEREESCSRRAPAHVPGGISGTGHATKHLPSSIPEGGDYTEADCEITIDVMSVEGPASVTAATPSCLQILPGIQASPIHSVSSTSVGRDYYDHKIVHITNVHEQPTRHAEVADATWKAIVQWLGGPDYRAIYEVAISQRMEGTGIWFLELDEFKRYVEGEGVTLWAMGIPGSGKTILAAIVVEYLEHRFHGQDVAICFAFLRYTEQHTSLDILSTLLSQLVEAHEGARSIIQPVYERITAKRGATLTESSAASMLRHIASSLSTVYVVLDGLDEASDQLRNRLLPILVSSGINLLIFSRPLEIFTHHTPNAMRIFIQARTEDIALYAEDQVKHSARLQAILQGKVDLVKLLCDRVKTKSDGMFLVAKLQMESIVHRCNSINGLFKALDYLPSSVDDIYRHTLDRIDAQPKEDAEMAYRVFLWLLNARPFQWGPDGVSSLEGSYQYPTAEDIQHAVTMGPKHRAFREGDVVPLPLLLSMCGGLVTVEQKKEVNIAPYNELRFIHATTEDYLRRTQFPGQHDPHATLALACISFMDGHMEHLRELYEPSNHSASDARHAPDEECTVIQLNHDGPSSEFGEPSHLLRHPLLAYAGNSWGYHASMCRRNHAVVQRVSYFLSQYSQHPFYHRVIPKDSAWFKVFVVTGLHIAAFHGLVEVITPGNLACKPAPRGPARGCTPFHFAAMSGNVDSFIALASTYGGVSPRYARGETPLHTAVKQGQVSFVRQILARRNSEPGLQDLLEAAGIDVNARDVNGSTPLILACHYDQTRGRIDPRSVEMVRALSAAQDVQVNLRDAEGLTAFAHACGTYNSTSTQEEDTVADTLISLFPNLDISGRRARQATPFMMACDHGLIRTVKWMLTCSVQGGTHLLNEVDSQWRNPLMRFCAPGGSSGAPHYPTIFELLVADGDKQSLRSRDIEGNTALLLAAAHFDRPFMQSVEIHGNEPYILRRLLELEPALIKERNGRGETALILAARQCHSLPQAPQVIRFLLSQYDMTGSSHKYVSHCVNAQDDEGKSALIAAVAEGRGPGTPEVIAALLSHPLIDINVRDKSGRDAFATLLSIHHSYSLSRTTHVARCARLLLDHPTFEISVSRDVIIRSFSEVENASESTHLQVASTLLLLAINGGPSRIFYWTLEEPETSLLLIYTLRRRCRIFAGIVLHCLGALGPPVFSEPGWGYCPLQDSEENIQDPDSELDLDSYSKVSQDQDGEKGIRDSSIHFTSHKALHHHFDDCFKQQHTQYH